MKFLSLRVYLRELKKKKYNQYTVLFYFFSTEDQMMVYCFRKTGRNAGEQLLNWMIIFTIIVRWCVIKKKKKGEEINIALIFSVILFFYFT